MILIEFYLSVLVLLLSFAWPTLGSRWLEAAERKLGALARRRKTAVLVVGLLALGARLAVLPILPVPQPHVDDGFSYLLAADTFVRGRLTNPTPPMWQHFQTLHEIMRPTYQSKFFPAQGLVLALGKVLLGHAFWGVWLSIGAMCAAICWALQAWVGPEWALLGGLIAVMRWGVFSYWADSYWGGAVAALGGALVLGALPRIFESKRPRDALLMGFGLAVMANSRPYEGLIFSLPVAVALLAWLVKRRGAELRFAVQRVALPLAVVLLVAGMGMAYYYWRVTGHPFRMTYQIYYSVYDPVPPLLGFPLHKFAVPASPPMRWVSLHYEMSLYRESHSPSGLLAIWMIVAFRMWVFFLGPILSLPLLAALLGCCHTSSPGSLEWRSRFLLWASLVCLAGLGLELYGLAHYAAPMTCLLLAVLLLAMRAVRNWSWRSRHVGLFVARGVPVVCVAMLALRAAAGPLGIPVKPEGFEAWYSSNPVPPVISRVRGQAERLPGRQLVFVRYGSYLGRISTLEEPNEWAWNSPDIPSQKVIWANDLGPSENEELIRYFKDRNAWLLDLGSWPPTLSPYPRPSGP